MQIHAHVDKTFSNSNASLKSTQAFGHCIMAAAILFQSQVTTKASKNRKKIVRFVALIARNLHKPSIKMTFLPYYDIVNQI